MFEQYNQQNDFENLPEKLPASWLREVEGLPDAEAATHFSKHRTQMSMHRTNLSVARTFLSNERTHLSYLRTSLSLISFGITLNRFSVFLRQSKILHIRKSSLFETEYAGLGMVVLGMAILAWSLMRYMRVEKEIGISIHHSPRRSIIFMTSIILFFGCVTTVWLFLKSH